MHYELEEISMGRISYSCENVEINIYYERVSFEIYLTVLLKGRAISCTIDEIIQERCAAGFRRQYLCAANEETVKKSVAEISCLFKKHGGDFMDGSLEAFESIGKKREERKRRKIISSRCSCKKSP
jgi:hypothetical protein